MSDVEIAVQAEGVEDAVGEVPPGEAGGGEAAGPMGGGGGAGGGKLGKLLGILAAVLAFSEDIFKIVGVVSSILRAFLAPVAVLLLRLLSPVLREMIKVLPKWFQMANDINELVSQQTVFEKIATLLGGLVGGLAGAKVGAVVGSIIGGFLGSVVPGAGTAIGAAVGAKVGAVLGGLIGAITGGATLAKIATPLRNMLERLGEIARNLPGVGSFFGGGDGGGGGDGDTGVVGRAQQTVVNIGGGLSSFVDEVTQDSGVETP